MKAELEYLEPVWRALANPIRRRILDMLRDGPRTTGQLSDHFNGHSRFAVMQHLAVLVESGLIHQQKEGRQRFNHLNAFPIQQIHDRWLGKYLARSTETARTDALDVNPYTDQTHGRPP